MKVYMKVYNWDKTRLSEAVSNSVNYRDVLRILGVPPSGNNTSTLKRKIDAYNISISHFTFSPRRKAKKPLAYYLTKNSHCSRSALKTRLIREGYKLNRCEMCGLSEWNGKPLTMQLHHVDGDCNNNSLDNLMMVCPNCHAQTDNYRGLANKKADKVKNYCQDCGREISRHSTRCSSCAAKKRAKSNVSITMTIEEFKSYKDKGYPNTLIAKIYGVTETAIRKWRERHSL